MAFSLLASTTAAPGANGGASSAIDTTGADLLLACVVVLTTVPTLSMSDSNGNTWTALTTSGTSGTLRARIYYCLPSSVGAGHTFTFTGTGTFAEFTVLAFSGVRTASALDQQNGAAQTASAVATLDSGAITPSADGALIVTLLGLNATTTSNVAGGSFSAAIGTAFSTGNNMGGYAAWQVQSVAASISATWTWVTNSNCVVRIVSFNPALVATRNLAALGVG